MMDERQRAKLEQDAVRGVWRSSPAFRAFYLAERPKICAPVFWHELPATAPENGTCIFDGTSKTFHIHLRALPADDVRITAHEIYHACLYCAGYLPPTDVKPGVASTGAALMAELLHEPMIALALHHYGIDHSIDTNRFTTNRADPPDKLNRLALAWAWLADDRTHRAITGQGLPTADEFRKAHPRTWEAVEKTRRVIDRVGDETVEQHDEIYRRLIRDFRLEDELRIAA